MFNFNKKIENRVTVIFVILFALVITSVIIYLNSTHQILGHSYRDVYFYLIESLRFSGVNIGGYEYVNYLPPFLPFLTSILFRLGFVSESSIFITSGVFFFVAILGMFYILRLRFNNFYSFFGTFLYGTLLINIKWVANGTLDIAFVGLMIWALYFFIQAMEKNQNYFYLAFPLVVLSFFTKYTGAIIVGVMILYFMSRTNIAFNIKKYFKHLFGGIILGVLTSIPFFAYFFIYNIPLGFLNQADEISSASSLAVNSQGEHVGNDLFFYLAGLVNNISYKNDLIAIFILVIVIIGICVMFYWFLKTFKNSYVKIKNSKSNIYKFIVPIRLIYTILIISIVMIIMSFLTAGLFSFVYSELLLFGGMFLLAYSLTKIIINYENVDNIWLSTYPYLAINITMIGLFLSYFIFFSSHLTKADRYFTSMAPGFIFLVTISVEILMSKIKDIKIGKFNLKYLIPIFMMLLMLSVAFEYLGDISDDQLVISEKNASKWISGKQGMIFSDRGPVYTWYLQKEIGYARNVGNSHLLSQELIDNDVDYYLSMDKFNITGYTIIKDFGNVSIYEREY